MFRKWFRKTMCMVAAIHETGGASAFPGSGIAGTTLTVMALTVRACRNLFSQYRGTA